MDRTNAVGMTVLAKSIISRLATVVLAAGVSVPSGYIACVSQYGLARKSMQFSQRKSMLRYWNARF